MSEKQPKKPYKDSLDKATLERYNQKIDVIGFDPYELKKGLTSDYACLPPVTYIDIINYLVNSRSAYTMEQLKAVKSLEAYNQFVNGWVQDVKSITVNNKIVVIGRVRHSQRMNEKALRPWFIATPEGTVDSAHCDCMAGLGEACSHVGALLFFVDQANRINSNKTVTQEKAYWLMPTGIDRVPYSEVGGIDFTSASTKKKHLDSEVCGNSVVKKSSIKLPNVPETTEDEMKTLNDKLFSSQAKCAILSVKKDYQSDYVPNILKEGNLPLTLISMKTDENMALSPKTLKEKCRQVFSEMQVTKDQAHNAEYLTRDQSQCKEWHALRTGRITASNMKAVCSASIEKPAMSTLNSICGTSRYSNKAIMWGCRHESSALLEYSAQYKKDHTNVKIDKCGLFINPKYPHLGASPDGLVSCDCCGEGVIEVKCPFCVKDKKISESDDKIEFLNHGKLKENHKYYYQVQTQMLITEKEFCDFVVWTQEEMTVQRIEPDQDSHDEIVTKSTNFFVQVVLPELMGNFVTRDMLESKKKKADENAQKSGEKSDENKIKLKDKLQQISVLKPTENVQHEQNKVDSEAKKDCEIICLCQKPYDEDEDDVIGCDDENCPYVWFHFSCVGIRKVPKGKYFCPYCFQGKRKKPKKAIK